MARHLAALAAATTLLLLSGCATPPEQAPTPAPSLSTPLFASDEEATVAASDALARYLGTLNAIRNDGGSGPERIHQVATEEWAAGDLESFGEFAASGERQIGEIRFDGMRYESSYGPREATVIAANVCFDYSERQVVDKHGAHIDLSDVPLRTAFRVEVSNAETGSTSNFEVNDIEQWPDRAC